MFIPSDMFMEYFQPLLNCSIQKSWLDHMKAHIVMLSDLTVCLRVITMEIGSLKLDFETRFLKRRTRGNEVSLNIAKKKWLTVGRPCRCKTFPFRMSKNNSELWNLFPELLNCFICIFIFFFTHLVWNYLVVKMRFERPTCCIGRGTFCIQISCSNNSAISPTENLATSH